MRVLLALVSIFMTVNSRPQGTGCSLDVIKDFTHEHPLTLKPNENEFILPTKNGIQLASDDIIRLECTGKRNGFKFDRTVKIVTAKCIEGTRFSVQDDEMDFKDLGCVGYPYHTARYTGENCSEIYKEIEIGFDTSKGFVRLILNCFDTENLSSMYSSHLLPATIDQQQEKVPRPGQFIIGNFFGNMRPNPASLYTRKAQRANMAKLLKSQDLADKYISTNSDYFLARGHLTPKADFVYAAQQRATFYYINVDPQWQTFNGGNWEVIESSVRNFASDNNINIMVYTGVYGTASLPDENNNEQHLYLHVDKFNAIPVPEIYWKVVYEPLSKKAIAFVGVNNPYEKNLEKKMYCKNICNTIDWIKWDPTDNSEGFSYCCEVSDLRKTVKYIPEFEVKGLLR